MLYIGGSLQSRAVVFTPVPTTSHPNGTRVLGQTQFTVCQRQEATATAIWDNAYVAAGGGKLISGDFHRRGVLVWNPAPTTTNEAADIVLGQPDFATQVAGTGAAQMGNPSGQLWTDGIRVVVPDNENNRVLIWTAFPTTSGAPANLVLGQSGFGMGGAPPSPTASNLKTPLAAWSDGVRLVIADTFQNRVLIWNSFPTSNGQAADLVIGQPDFTTSSPGLSAAKMASPRGIAGSDGALFVSDYGNDRVLVFSPFPTVNGEAATFVLGQPDLNTGSNNPAATDRDLSGPDGLELEGQHLWVDDHDHERVLRFTLTSQ